MSSPHPNNTPATPRHTYLLSSLSYPVPASIRRPVRQAGHLQSMQSGWRVPRLYHHLRSAGHINRPRLNGMRIDSKSDCRLNSPPYQPTPYTALVQYLRLNRYSRAVSQRNTRLAAIPNRRCCLGHTRPERDHRRVLGQAIRKQADTHKVFPNNCGSRRLLGWPHRCRHSSRGHC